MSILLKDKVDKEFVEMLMNDDSIERFMLCTPFTTDDVLKYGGDLTEDLFYEKLYIDPLKNSVENQIIRCVKKHNKNTIYILGNKGCGKSTFVHSIKRKLDCDESVWCEIIDFGESNSTLKYKKSIEVIVRKIYKLLKNLLTQNTKESDLILNSFIQFYFDNAEEIDEDWDSNKKIEEFFEILSSIINMQEINKFQRLEKEVRKILFNSELFQLFFILSLLFMHVQIGTRNCVKPMVIVLDNLDNMIEITEVKRFIEHYRNYLQAIGTFITRSIFAGKKKYSYQIVYVLVMREITRASISTPHSLELTRVTAIEYDLTELYPKKDISCRRTEYAVSLIDKIIQENFRDKKEIKEIKRQAIAIQDIVNDTYIYKTIYPLFNDDYRIATLMLVKICCENSFLLADYNQLMKCGIEGAKYGGRGIIYRLILNRFKARDYLKKIGIVDFKDRMSKKVSISRLLLTYLNNTTDPKVTGDSKGVSLIEIFKSFTQFKTKEIVNSLWEMCDLIKAEEWNPLITFVSSDNASKDGLFMERKIYKKNINKEYDMDNSRNYSFFRITRAGRIYLSNICIHFEFFACRIFGSSRWPLFCSKNFSSKDGEPQFKTIINSVFSEVKICCESLHDFESNERMGARLDSNLNYKKENGTYQYHGERIVFSHISYLEIFRCFLLIKHPQEIFQNKLDMEEISKYLIDIIIQYLNLFTKCGIGFSTKNKEGKYLKDIMINKANEAMKHPLEPNYTINIIQEE